MVSTRMANVGNCRRCGAEILIGIDNDWCGLLVYVDIAPISSHAEAVAKLTGIRTYEYSKGILYHRDRWMIKGKRPNSIDRYNRVVVVLQDHVCYSNKQHDNVVDHDVVTDDAIVWEDIGQENRGWTDQAMKDIESLRRKLSQRSNIEEFDQESLFDEK